MDVLEEGNGYISISTKLLKGMIHDYKKYMDYLEESGVITIDHHYIPDQKNKHYKLADEFESVAKKHVIITLKDNRSALRSYDRKRTEDLGFLEYYFNQRLTIDYAKATAKIDEIYEANCQHTRKKKRENAERIRNLHMNVVNRFRDQDFSLFQCDDTSGRLHTTLTKLKKECRKFLRYEGKPLVNVDIVSSQPFLSQIMLNRQLFAKFDVAKRIGRYNPDFIETAYWMSLGYIGQDEVVEVDCQYLRDVRSRDFYTAFKDHVNQDRRFNISRDEAKMAFMNSAFEDPKEIGNRVLMQIFENVYRRAYTAFSHINFGVDKNPHGTLACVLQWIESDLVLFKVCKRIHEEYPDIPMWTIHDSIMTTEGHENNIKAILEDELEKAIGVKPRVRVER